MVYITKETLEQWYKDSQNPRVNKTTEHSDFMSSPTEPKCENEAFKKIERLVKVRDRSVAEVTMRLEKDSYSSEYQIFPMRICRFFQVRKILLLPFFAKNHQNQRISYRLRMLNWCAQAIAHL